MGRAAPEGTKWCRGCNASLDLNCFGLKYAERGVRQGLCRVCQRAVSRMYYLRDPAPYKARAKLGRKKARLRNRERVLELLRSSKCADCGLSDFAVLEFDHLEPHEKRANVDRLVTHSWAAAAREIAKCDVVCANCHRNRTARHFGWGKLVGSERLVLPTLPKRGTPDYERVKSTRSRLARQHRNRSYMHQHLREHPCVLCGESDPVVLDFDH